jgi:hypothetical protein
VQGNCSIGLLQEASDLLFWKLFFFFVSVILRKDGLRCSTLVWQVTFPRKPDGSELEVGRFVGLS